MGVFPPPPSIRSLELVRDSLILKVFNILLHVVCIVSFGFGECCPRGKRGGAPPPGREGRFRPHRQPPPPFGTAAPHFLSAKLHTISRN